MNKARRYLMVICVFVLLTGGAAAFILAFERKPEISNWQQADRSAVIRPDYTGTVIAPNIAPLNFLVQEQGTYYHVKIHSKQGAPIEIFSRKGKIVIPENSWHRLLNANRGQPLYFDVFVQGRDGGWLRFETVENTIAAENIDPYIFYRKLHPTHRLFSGDIGIYQRDLRNYDERLVLGKKYLQQGSCLNCHTFCNNRTDKMLIGVRSGVYGNSTLLIEGGQVSKIDAKFGYSSWHPSGRLVVYSIDELPMFYHTARNEVRDTVHIDSLLAYHVLGSGKVSTCAKFSQKDRLETWPAWSPDGRYLYFCSAPKLWPGQEDELPPSLYNQAKYDIVRIRYDLDSDQWGELETVVSAQDTQLSAGVPAISPDGRWLLFCMFDYGYFPAWQQSSDLYIVDLQAAGETGQYKWRRLNINSDQSEAWHTWSSNSRWIVFSSKRDYGVFTRPYISYIDHAGRVYKPIVLPQKDPALYDHCLQTYNTPEFAIEPVHHSGEKLARMARRPGGISVDMPVTMATPITKTQPGYVPGAGERE